MPNTITRLKNVSEELIIEATARRQKIEEANKKVAASLDEHDGKMRTIIENGNVGISIATQRYLENNGHLFKSREEIIAETVGKELAVMSSSEEEKFFSRVEFKHLLGRMQMITKIFSENDKLKNYSLHSNGHNDFSIIGQNGNEITKLNFNYANDITFITMSDPNNKVYDPKNAFLFVGITDGLDRDNNEIIIDLKGETIYSFKKEGNNQRIEFFVDGAKYEIDKGVNGSYFYKYVDDKVDFISEHEILAKLNKFDPRLLQWFENSISQSFSENIGAKKM